MRTALLLLATLPALAAADQPAPRPNPTQQAELAAQYLAVQRDEETARNTRFASAYAVEDPADRVGLRRFSCWWLNQMSREQLPALLTEVRGSEGTLYAFDLRDFGWVPEAWATVARRDRVFVEGESEPLVPHRVARVLRAAIGATASTTGHVEAIVPLPWLVRETFETFRSPSYYDLLYGRERFGTGERREVEVEEQYTERVPVWNQYGQQRWEDVRKTRKVRKVQAVEGIKDFPRDKKDWDRFHGAADAQEFLKRQRIRTETGAVVAGMTEGKGGSLVARNNRLLLFLPTSIGIGLESFDADKAAGQQDYLEQSPDLAQGRIKFKAQELLYTLPNGGQAAGLFSFKGPRVEFADGTLAVGPDQTMGQVTGPAACFRCHAPDNGVIPPRNLVADLLGVGAELKTRDRNQARDFAGFYFGWERRLKGWQEPYAALLDATTREDQRDPASKSWTGAEAAKELVRWWHWYDAPVSPAQAARELGLAEADLKSLCSTVPLLVRDGRAKGGARAAQIVKGQAVPRPAWDEDLYPLLSVILGGK